MTDENSPQRKTIPIQSAPPAQPERPEALSRVRNIVAVGSGKGGVGKSTVAANLAAALAASGAKVGLMDADVYGPSQPGMMGAKGRSSDMEGELLKPAERHGVKLTSIGLLMENDGPVVWRAPMATKMISQFIFGVAWGELDYLLIDMPPGTGDIQLTLAQQAFLTGSLVVTTPQDVALGIAKKGLKMFQQVNVPILGIIENMSGFVCRKCGDKNPIFKEGGGERLAKEAGVPFLGAIPLDPEIVQSGDEGVPVVVKAPQSASALAFIRLAGSLKDLSAANRPDQEPREIRPGPGGELLIQWPDGHQSRFTPHPLRVNCTCAACVDEDTGRRTLDARSVPLNIGIVSVGRVGRYGLAVEFSDGHNTGIYTFKHLKEICECEDCLKRKNQAPSSFSV